MQGEEESKQPSQDQNLISSLANREIKEEEKNSDSDVTISGERVGDNPEEQKQEEAKVEDVIQPRRNAPINVERPELLGIPEEIERAPPV